MFPPATVQCDTSLHSLGTSFPLTFPDTPPPPRAPPAQEGGFDGLREVVEGFNVETRRSSPCEDDVVGWGGAAGEKGCPPEE